MRLGSILMFVLAIVFGIIAVALAQSYLEGRASFASRGPESGKLVATKTVVVAKRQLRFGTELTREQLVELEWPERAIPSGTFAKVSDLLDKKGRRVVLSPIEANEPVLSWKITGPGARATLSAVVDDGMRAVSVRMNDVLGVAGFVLPGDRVDIMLTHGGRGKGKFTDVLLQNIKVLAINQLADERADKPSPAKTVTVEVDSIDAQKLALAQTVGTLSLSLRSAGSLDAASPRRVSISDLGPAFKIYDDEATEEEPAKAPEPAPTPAPVKVVEEKAAVPFYDPNARIGVIRGLKREEYRVPKEDVN